MSYNFDLLSPIEFENLANDIAEKYFKNRVERFKAGKDSGIDGRIFRCGESIIIQSKHYKDVNRLRRILKEDKEKIKKINPQRYILFTSCPLSPCNKNMIRENLFPFIQDISDIWGGDDIDSFLLKNSDIENRYYKLWIGSSNILKRFLNNDVVEESDATLCDIYENTKNYGFTSVYGEAVEKLRTNNVIIITGGPGIGKTALAEQLCLYSYAEGYRFYCVDSIDKAYRVAGGDDRIVFYFDDFLGSNYLTALENRVGARICNFIRYVKRNNYRLILTSRTNIIDKAYQLSAPLLENKIKNNEYLLDIDKYCYKDKCVILCSMLQKSDLAKDDFSIFLDEGLLNSIVNHRNFNPRILGVITDSSFFSIVNHGVSEKDYSKESIVHNLDYPYKAWDHIFSHQLDEASKYLVILVVLFNVKQIEEDILIEVYNRLLSFLGLPLLENCFRDKVESLCRTFLIRNISLRTKKVSYSPFNPSIIDFIVNYLDGFYKIWGCILHVLRSDVSLQFLLQSKKGDDIYIRKVLSSVFEYSSHNFNEMSEYYIAVFNKYNIFPEWDAKDSMKVFLEKIATVYIFDMDISMELFKNIVSRGMVSNINAYVQFYIDLIECAECIDDLENLSRFLSDLEIEKNKLIENAFLDKFDSFIDDVVFDFICEDFYLYFSIEEDEDSGYETVQDIDYELIEKKLKEYLSGFDGGYINVSNDYIKKIVARADYSEIEHCCLNTYSVSRDKNSDHHAIDVLAAVSLIYEYKYF